MNFDFVFFWKLFWRRLPVMMVFVIGLTGLAVITAMKLPDTYSTSARLLVEAPQIPDSMVRATVQVDDVEQLDIIEQKLLTRANLIDIARKFDVFENAQEMDPDRVHDRMRSSTRIARSAGRNKATLMTISFEGRSARIVANVVNEYVTLVLEENTSFRVSRAESTLGFFEEEVERLGRDLDTQSTEIAMFRSDHADALPEEQSYRLARQTQLLENTARIERELTSLAARRTDVMRIFEATGSVSPDGPQQRTLEERNLITLKAELELALTQYTEENPRVKRLINQVERLEAIVDAQKKANVNIGADAPEDLTPERALLETTLSQIDSRVEFLESELNTTGIELERVQAAIARSAANGIELSSLERDYSVIQSRYNAAVTNLNQARMSERIESTAQGQRITIIENANVPSSPNGPNGKRIIAAGAGVGIMLAVGYFMLLELLNRTVRRPVELISRFDVAPIATIPYMESRARRFTRRAGLITATLAVLGGVPALLFYIDTNYLPLELVVQRGLSRLGLG